MGGNRIYIYTGRYVREREREMFYLTTHSTHFLSTVIWRQTYG